MNIRPQIVRPHAASKAPRRKELPNKSYLMLTGLQDFKSGTISDDQSGHESGIT